MIPTTTLVVRYDESGRLATDETLQRLVRKQGVLLLILGMLLGLLVLVPFVTWAATMGGVDVAFVLAVAALLVVPIALCALGVRQLRRRLRMPEVAVTITPTDVLFPAMDRPSALMPRVRAEEWTRTETTARLIPAAGLNDARVEFTWEHAGKRRRRSIAAGNIDVDPYAVVAALGAAREV
ncbi:hypothetical protein [Gulosibacter sediminis]|uniref:hypothetical protein n=1 Tax=Gulosibacter sediminis TaxID=1729695 RepID=UPI0024ACA7B8|nr:hypothetical protein [Gulosibacter sediminis]